MRFLPAVSSVERADEARARLGVEPPDVVGADEVLAHRAVEGEQVLDRGLGVVGEVADLAGEPVDHAGAELVAGGVGDDAGVGLVADPQAVLGEQGGGVGVVGGDGGLERLVVGVARRPVLRRAAPAATQRRRGSCGAARWRPWW